MSWLRLANYFAFSFAIHAFGCSEHSETGVVGETVKCALDDAAPESSFFDGKTLKLRAARGETLGLQVFPSRHSAEVRLTFSEDVARVQAFRVGFVDVREPSTKMYGSSSGRGRYPDILFPQAPPVIADREAFFDVAVKQTAAAGIHRGELLVDGVSRPVQLTIEAVTIDLADNPLVWVFYHPKEIARVHGVADDDGPAEIELERRYEALFRSHGAYLASDLPPRRFPARKEFAADLPYWPVAVDTSDPKRLAADVQTWIQTFRGTKTVPFAIPVDEPKTAEQRKHAKDIADQIAKAGGGRPRLLRGVTDRASAFYGDSFDLYFAPLDIPQVAAAHKLQGERFWTYNGKPPQAGSMIIDTDGAALRTWGWIAYRYDIDLWYAWEGLYYSDRYNGGGPTNVFVDPLTFDERPRGEDFGNGDGLLAYPGAVPSLRLKALRRGLQDRLLLLKLASCGGEGDADAIARNVMPRALGEAHGDAAWPHDEMTWELARSEILDAVARRCSDAA